MIIVLLEFVLKCKENNMLHHVNILPYMVKFHVKLMIS